MESPLHRPPHHATSHNARVDPSASTASTSFTRHSTTNAEDHPTPPAESLPPLPVQNAISVGRSGRLFWCSTNTVPRSNSTSHFFSADSEFVYSPFYADFGPLNLGHVYRYCELLEKKFNDPHLARKRLIHCSSNDPRIRPNGAFLICSYQIVVCKMSAIDAYAPFANITRPFAPFRDATCGTCTYQLTVLQCLQALEFAIGLGWFHRETFNIEEYEQHERVEQGDLNWIIPGKFLAFSGPSSGCQDREGFITFTPEDYVDLFKEMGVRLVIRLNKKQYDRRKFTQKGIEHADLYFLDGSCPSRDIIDKFLRLCENESGPVAVHCKAGLGRTGTLIGCYAVKNYKFPAALWIGWNRICRPGSILGPQQHFLPEVESELMALPSIIPQQLVSPTNNICPPLAAMLGKAGSEDRPKVMSSQERRVATHGDSGQGERLVHARQSPNQKFFPMLEDDATPSTTASSTPPTSTPSTRSTAAARLAAASSSTTIQSMNENSSAQSATSTGAALQQKSIFSSIAKKLPKLKSPSTGSLTPSQQP